MTMENDGAASELNRELTGLLVQAGRSFGYGVVPEYPVRGGRLDVVWTWSPKVPFPLLDHPVPVVGFEIESSWRTRKHVKGDLLNLQDAGVSLGVIVLAGSEAKDDGLRRFAELLVDRPGPTILIWTAEDVRALAGQRHSAQQDEDPLLPEAPPDTHRALLPVSTENDAHAGKYAPLYRWLRTQGAASITLSFCDVEEVLGFPLPNSCRQHVPHWHSYEGSAVARAIIDAGWRASGVHLAEESLTLTRQMSNRRRPAAEVPK